MFDIGFSELFLIAIVALVVLGPERLPKAARFAGLWVRRARNQWASVKSELERELAADEFKRTLHDTESAMRDIDADVRAADADARREFDEMRRNLDGPSASKARKAAAAAAAAGSDAAEHETEPSAAPRDAAREDVDSDGDGDSDGEEAEALMTGPPVAAGSTLAESRMHDAEPRMPTNDAGPGTHQPDTDPRTHDDDARRA